MQVQSKQLLEVSDDVREIYNIFENRTITINVAEQDASARQGDEKNIQVTFKSCAPFTECIIKIINIQVDKAKYLDVGMRMYRLIEKSNNYAKHQENYGSTTKVIKIIT